MAASRFYSVLALLSLAACGSNGGSNEDDPSGTGGSGYSRFVGAGGGSSSGTGSTDGSGGTDGTGSSTSGTGSSTSGTGSTNGTGSTSGTGGQTGLDVEETETWSEFTTPIVVNVDAPASLHIEAECAHGTDLGSCDGNTSGSASGTALDTSGSTTVVGYIDDDDWFCFDGLELSQFDEVRIHYASGAGRASPASFQVRSGSSSGTILGSVSVVNTGGWYTFITGTVEVSGAAGSTLCIVGVTTDTTRQVANVDSIELLGETSSTITVTGVEALPTSLLAQEQTETTVKLRFNHIGYSAKGAKKAIVESSAPLSRFQVVTGDTPLYEGELTAMDAPDWNGGPYYYVADFSALQSEGSFQLRVNGQTSAQSFRLGSRLLFDETFQSLLDYFELSRADDSTVWNYDDSVLFYGSTTQREDVRGGWYDASGDISKYLSHQSAANFINPQQIPMTAWALAWVRDEAASILSGEQQDQAQDEALWGADYLVRVQHDADDYFFITIFDQWTGILSNRRITAWETSNGTMTTNWQAAFREGAGLAIASLARIAAWNVDSPHTDGFTAAQYLAAAESGFAHLQAVPGAYANDGKENVIDDYTALLAATELYAATGTTSYRAAARERAASLAARLSDRGYFIADDGSRPFWHAADAGLPIVALWRYHQVETDDALRAAAKDAIAIHLGYLLEITNVDENPYGYARQTINVYGTGVVKDSFFIPHDNETGYWWQGEDARLASLTTAAYLGSELLFDLVPTALQTFGTDQLNWVAGGNPFDVCMIHGQGRNNPNAYEGDAKAPIQMTWDGGIANGITGKNSDGSGLEWDPAFGSGGSWQNWRWVEQWLPHSTWYMMAVTAQALHEPQ